MFSEFDGESLICDTINLKFDIENRDKRLDHYVRELEYLWDDFNCNSFDFTIEEIQHILHNLTQIKQMLTQIKASYKILFISRLLLTTTIGPSSTIL